MAPFFQQIFSILIAPPGNLFYHLVLAFTLIAVIQPALLTLRSQKESGAATANVLRHPGLQTSLLRLLVGLGMLLFGQIILFAASGLTWQGMGNAHTLLPPLDRAISLFCLLWIIWLWVFPNPSRAGDAATIIVSALVIILAALTLVFWSQQAADASFNASWMGFSWELFSLVIVLIGGLLLLSRQPEGWGFGLGMLVLIGAGNLVQMLSQSSTGDYSGPLRLAQLAAYPLLMALPQRVTMPEVVTEEKQTGSAPYHPGVERRRYSADPKAVYAFLDLARENSPVRVCTAITRAIGQAMLADLCYLISIPDDRGQVVFQGGYDLIREDSLQGGIIAREKIPQLANALQKGRPLRLYANNAVSPDLSELGGVIGFRNLESLLSVPVITPDSGNPIGGILLLSPYSNRAWTADDQAYLATTAEAMAEVIQRVQENDRLRIDLEQMQVDLELARGRLEQVQADQDVVVGMQAIASETISPSEQLSNSDHLENELHQSLKEVAYLKNALAETNMQLIELEKRAKNETPISSEQAEVMASLAQELRQPMSSITGYTDLLLGESVGILGALQRKFLERISASTERMRGLIDDLIQLAAMSNQKLELDPETVDLGAIIDNALAYTSAQVREKNLTLRLDFPEQFPQLHADRDALQQIVIHLLQNAGAATPVEGTVRMKVSTEKEGDQEFVLLQVTDSGGGIPEEDLPRVFSRLYRADNALIQGVGDTGVGLSIAKTLVEAHDGRIWVESSLGHTTTFSVLLPIQAKAPIEETSSA
jgi:signal transduction histidine kinase